MRRHHTLPTALTLLLALVTLPTRAWNATGHQVVAQIAWRDLKPAAREKLLTLLKQHPHFAKLIEPADVKPDDPDYAMRAFMNAATWPDLIRPIRGNAAQDYHHPEWHYINLPILLEGTDRATLTLPPLDEKLDPSKPPANVSQALAWSNGVLRNPDAVPADRAVALAWLEHLVGDVHQPLHCSALFGPQYQAGDRGGNLFLVKYHGNLTNLHSFWDNLLGGYQTPKLVAAVTDKVIQKHPRAALAKELAANKFTDWSAESFALAKDTAYAGGKLKGVTREASVADKGATTPELPEGYEESARAAANLRIALAGYRLADLLNDLFK